MRFDQPASDTVLRVLQVLRVLHGVAVAAVAGDATRPLCNRGVATQHRTTKSKTPTPWPPPEYALPDNLDTIEQGRRQQRELFPVVPDDSQEGRLARLLALPGAGLDFQAANDDNVPGGRIRPATRA